MRLRFRFSKLGKVRWTSHRDVARMWERAFRRVQLPLAYTQGFSPRPRLSFGLALPTGAESVAEYLDVELGDGVAPDLDDLPARLGEALPEGVGVMAAAVVEAGAPSLQHEVTSCSWVIDTAGVAPERLAAAVASVVNAPSLVVSRERKGERREDDVRPAILTLSAAGSTLFADLATQPRALRPSELLAALGDEVEATRVCRTFQWIERDGARREPIALPLDATDAPHVVGRAS